MHGPLSIGATLAIGVAAIAGIIAGFSLPASQSEQRPVAAAPTFDDPRVASLHEGCMIGHFSTDSYRSPLQRKHCNCNAEGESASIQKRHVSILAALFNNSPTRLAVELACPYM